MLGFIRALMQGPVIAELAEKNPDIVVLTQDMGGIGSFAEKFPDRFFDVGISEANLIGVAAGLAQVGKLPFVFAMAPFITMRSFEQIRDDCGYNRNNVKIIAPCTGLETGAWGATHHAVEDLALLRTIPGMTILCPADPDEGTRAVLASAKIDGPVYIRFGYIESLEGYEDTFEIGKAPAIREGTDVAIIATGASVAQAIKAHDILKGDGLSARVINMHTIKPIDREVIETAAKEIGHIITVEEHFVNGGLGGAVAEVMAELGHGRLVRLGLQDEFVMEVASYPEILGLVGLDGESIAASARTMLE